MRSSKFTVALAREALAARSESAQGWLRGTAAGRTAQRVLSGFAEAEWADRSMTLAAQSFTSVLPVAIVASSLGDRGAFTRGFFDQFGIDLDGVAVGVDSVGIEESSFAVFGIVGVLMVLIGGTSFARALGRMYGRIWKVPTLRLTSWWRWIAVLLSMGSAAALIGATRILSGVPYLGAWLTMGAQFAVWVTLWTLIPYLLTEQRLSARVLWAMGVATAVGLAVLRAVGNVVLPIAMESSETKYGALGLVFTAIGWMFVAYGIVVGAAVLTKAFALDEGPIGRLLRGPVDAIDDAPAPAPAPAHTDPH